MEWVAYFRAGPRRHREVVFVSDATDQKKLASIARERLKSNNGGLGPDDWGLWGDIVPAGTPAPVEREESL